MKMAFILVVPILVLGATTSLQAQTPSKGFTFLLKRDAGRTHFFPLKLIDGHTLLVASDGDNTADLLDASTGKRVDTFSWDLPLAAPPVLTKTGTFGVVNQMGLFGGRSFLKIAGTTGWPKQVDKFFFTTGLPGPIETPQGLVYWGPAGSGYKRMVLLNQDGSKKWEVKTDFQSSDTEAISDGQFVYFTGEENAIGGGTMNPRVFSCELATGKHIWEYAAKRPITGDLLLDGDRLVIPERGQVSAIATKDGKDLWVFKGKEKSPASLLKTPNSLVVSTFDGTVSALDPNTGNALWTHDLQSESRYGSSLLSDKILVPIKISKSISRILALSLKTGDPEFVSEDLPSISTPLLVDGDAIIFGSSDAHIYSIKFN